MWRELSVLHLAQLTLALVSVVDLLGQRLVLLLQLLQRARLCRVCFLQGLAEKITSTAVVQIKFQKITANCRHTGIIFTKQGNQKFEWKLTFPDTDSSPWPFLCTAALWMHSDLPWTWNFHSSFFQAKKRWRGDKLRERTQKTRTQAVFKCSLKRRIHIIAGFISYLGLHLLLGAAELLQRSPGLELLLHESAFLFCHPLERLGCFAGRLGGLNGLWTWGKRLRNVVFKMTQRGRLVSTPVPLNRPSTRILKMLQSSHHGHSNNQFVRLHKYYYVENASRLCDEGATYKTVDIKRETSTTVGGSVKMPLPPMTVTSASRNHFLCGHQHDRKWEGKMNCRVLDVAPLKWRDRNSSWTLTHYILVDS